MNKNTDKTPLQKVAGISRDDYFVWEDENKTILKKSKTMDKTPLQQLIEWVDKEVLTNNEYDGSPRLQLGTQMVKEKATELPPTEQAYWQSIEAGSTTQLAPYWQKRCEAAEALIHRYASLIPDSPEYMNWQTAIGATPPADKVSEQESK